MGFFGNFSGEVADEIFDNLKPKSSAARIPELKSDFVSCWFPTHIWALNGAVQDMRDLMIYTLRGRPKFIAEGTQKLFTLGWPIYMDGTWRKSNLKSASLEYARFWERLLADGVEFSKNELKPTNVFTVKSRFFSVPANNPIRPLKLFIIVPDSYAAKWLPLDRVKNLCDQVVEKKDNLRGNTLTLEEFLRDPTANPSIWKLLGKPQCRFIVATHKEMEDQLGKYKSRLVRISTHPLDLYSTYLTPEDLPDFVQLQAGGRPNFYRDLPSDNEVKIINKLVIEATKDDFSRKFRGKMSQVAPKTTTDSTLRPSVEGVTRGKRDPTESIMRISANKVCITYFLLSKSISVDINSRSGQRTFYTGLGTSPLRFVFHILLGFTP
jgi:hypothetical protein